MIDQNRPYRLRLADCFPPTKNVSERLAEMGLGFLVEAAAATPYEPACVTSADVEQVERFLLAMGVPKDGAFDIDFEGMGAVSPGAVRKMWARWPNARFIALEADHTDAIKAGLGQDGSD